jgi:hypothetical protein
VLAWLFLENGAKFNSKDDWSCSGAGSTGGRSLYFTYSREKGNFFGAKKALDLNVETLSGPVLAKIGHIRSRRAAVNMTMSPGL